MQQVDFVVVLLLRNVEVGHVVVSLRNVEVWSCSNFVVKMLKIGHVVVSLFSISGGCSIVAL